MLLEESRKRRIRGKKRTIAVPASDNLSAEIQPFQIGDMVLKAQGVPKVYFKRLRYEGCPSLSKRGELLKPETLVDMNRDDLIRSLFLIFNRSFNVTWKGHFDCLINYIRWFDTNGFVPIDGDYFTEEYTDAYMSYWSELIKKGKYGKSTWSNHKKMLSAILKELNRHVQAKNLVSIKGLKNEASETESLTVEELKLLNKALFKAYSTFQSHYLNGTKPEVHPLFNEELLQNQQSVQGWSQKVYNRKVVSFRHAVSNRQYAWVNHMTRISILLTFMFTGMNTFPLLSMKLSDVKFKQVGQGKYVFDNEKDRAEYQQQDSTVGFSKFAKNFVESWLKISTDISSDIINPPLFPWITETGEVVPFIDKSLAPQDSVNKLLDYLGLPSTTSRRFRKTKLDILMKVTEDVYLVSVSGNNSVKTIQSNYSGGNKADHHRNLTASLSAQYNFFKGESLDGSIQEAKFKYHDVLSDYEYKNIRSKSSKESKTPLGVRCQNNTGGLAEKIKRTLDKAGIKTSSNEHLCTDFLECFDCGDYKLVAEVDDIWLMLSFKETLEEMKSLPAVNSLPAERFTKLFNTINSILSDFKIKASKNFYEAEELLSESPHPLYEDIYSIDDLLAIFAW